MRIEPRRLEQMKEYRGSWTNISMASRMIRETRLSAEFGIRVFVKRQAVLDYVSSYDYENDEFGNNHLYREAISLAAVW